MQVLCKVVHDAMILDLHRRGLTVINLTAEPA